MKSTLNSALTSTDLEFYRREGYIHAPAVVPEEALGLAHIVLERWVDQLIESWVSKGLLKDEMKEEPFETRLVKAWNAAGRPSYARSPRRDLVSLEMYQFLSHPSLLDLMEAILGTSEISVHGVFNARPKLPDQKWTDTPWHQDAQYFREAADRPVVTIWMPLQRVTEKNSCLQVAPRLQNSILHEGFKDEASGFIGLPPEEQKKMKGISIEMNRGDALCFPQKTPHRALPNSSQAVRWSMDFRYEPTPGATEHGKKQGFIARSEKNPESVTSYEEWLKKWEGIPAGSY